MTQSTAAFVGLGSNLSQPEQQVRSALIVLAESPRWRLIRSSRLFRSPPWGLANQPAFVNAAVELCTTLDPFELLAELRAIETAAGRVQRERWGPRVLDLDILQFGDLEFVDPCLTVPHPHAHERGFVLVPLAEIAPELVLRGRGRVMDLLTQVDCRAIEALG